MNISIFIGRRLSFKDSAGVHNSGSASAGVPIAVGGIALAVIIMMVSISVVMGFKDEIRKKVTGFSSEITIYPQSRTLSSIAFIDYTPELAATLKSVLPDSRFDGVVELPGILKTEENFQGVMVKAYQPGADGFRFIEEYLTDGVMPRALVASDSNGVAPQPEITLSVQTSSKLGLSIGDKVDMHFVSNGALRTRRALVSGLYDTNLGEYDSRFVYASPDLVRSIAKLFDNQVTAIEINGVDERQVSSATANLSSVLLDFSSRTSGHNIFFVDNVLRSGQAYFSWLDLLDTNVIVILMLMALVSGFTIISSLFILILERVRTIGILKSLGATNRQIRGIFIYMAERLVVCGLIIGNIGGLAIILTQHYLHLIPLDAESYFLSSVPVALCWGAFAALNIAVVAISAIVLILPSHMIATLAPSESMRYE